MGGGGLMIWGAISNFRKWKFTVFRVDLNTINYLKMMKDVILPFKCSLRRRTTIYQQDNALVRKLKDVLLGFRPI